GLGKNIRPRLHKTASKLPSKNESACPSSTETDAFGALPKRSRALSTMAGERSEAVTWPVGPTAARAASAERPVPVAMSRTHIPGATSAARNRNGMKYLVTCAKARSYSAAASFSKRSSSVIRLLRRSHVLHTAAVLDLREHSQRRRHLVAGT